MKIRTCIKRTMCIFVLSSCYLQVQAADLILDLNPKRVLNRLADPIGCCERFYLLTHYLAKSAYSTILNKAPVSLESKSVPKHPSVVQQILAMDDKLQVTVHDENNIKIACNKQTATVTKNQLAQSITLKHMFGDIPSANVTQVIKNLFVNIENKDYIILALQQLTHVEQINDATCENDKQEKRKDFTQNLKQYEDNQLISMMLAANYLDIQELLDTIAHVVAQNLVTDKALKK